VAPANEPVKTEALDEIKAELMSGLEPIKRDFV
jgi:hypothetical protein